MPGSKVLVLGGTGPAGICLLRELIHRNHEVVAFARNPKKIPEDVSSSPLIEIIEGQLNDAEALSTAVSKSYVVVSLLGPNISSWKQDPSLLADFYRHSLFPSMRQHGVKRVYAMGTLSIVRPEDSRSLLRYGIVTFTIFRIAGIPGESDHESWKRDREDGKAFVGWVAETGWTMSQKRGALARWLVDAVEGGLTDWIGKMPAVSKLAGS
ncbi:NAD(P)-bd-dom domain-containing protein [Fusarium sp. Ph1]|nr:NAD(P)-bd-dom domain-containing protein [Fusarium sp. Ph1]